MIFLLHAYKRFEDLIVFLAVGSQRQTALQQQEPQGKIYVLLFVACKKKFLISLQFIYNFVAFIHTLCFVAPHLLCGSSQM